MSSTFTIGRLGRECGVPASTVRYYERLGILRAEGRTDGNYRLYGADALERLRFIRAAQANGFTLDDVATLLRFRDGVTAPCKEVQTLIEQRLADLDERIEQMRHVQAVLRTSLRMCRQVEASGRCQVVDTLRSSTSSPPRKPRRRPRPGKAKKSSKTP